ncbi:MAG TPA: hypothetical protein VK059_01235, partial [Nocardioidaceae bacterium]|nr:hypothetical protein [Nocardioidaceae bacterium]
MKSAVRSAAIAAALALTASGAVSVPADAGPSASPEPAAKRIQVKGAKFIWGLSNESSNRGYAPNTYNFFSAGKIKNPGKSRKITKGEWTRRTKRVAIQKRKPNGRYRLATWRGLRTRPNGKPIGAPTTATFSHHRVLMRAGKGRINPKLNTAKIHWKGSFTVLYYSGYTFFYVSNPTLTVRRNGVGTVVATLGGYGTSRSNPSKWVKLPNKRVRIATLRGVNVTKNGIRTKPKYRKVKYNPPKGAPGSKQVRTGKFWGSWPRPFVNY